ncbi:MAG: ATP cone domain-containing protein [Minisyncoccia bacterium]
MVKNTISSKNNAVLVKSVQKRDGTIIPFDLGKIVSAIHKAMLITGEGSLEEAELVATKVFADLVRISKKFPNFIPTVEGLQDSVEKELILGEYVKTAKEYILYRQERTRLRETGVKVPEKVKKLTAESKKYFKNSLGELVYYRSYARWIDAEGRRETWIETVDRYLGFMKGKLGKKLTDAEYKELREAILNQDIMPSMRLFQFSGPAAEKTNVCAYNCSFIAPTALQDFAEIMYISMCGTGVGFSVESKFIQSLPQIKIQTGKKLENFVIPDSKEGWADALTHGLKAWFNGHDVEFDYSQIRPAGARLKVMGGKASGPEPLIRLLNLVRMKVLHRQGRRLTNLDAHDIICSIGDCVVAGGVRRSALISLSDLDDEAMRDAKKGQFFLTDPQRQIANNSAVYEQKPSNPEFMDEWIALMKSGSGERGIFNRGALLKTLPERRLKVLKGYVGDLGTNPCGEIILQSKQFCNLSEVVARHEDTEKTLLKKIKLATIIGTYQATLTNFGYLSKEWKENCEKERLLGVSITGQWDCPAVRKAEVLRKLRAEAIKANEIYAKRFGINAASCITCVKPSGTVSQTVDCASGMHQRHSRYYIRRIRISTTDSLFKMLKDQGVPYFPEVGQSMGSATTYVLEFPIAAPEGSIFRNDLSALEQLEYWKVVKENYTEHNPSITISVGETEWIEVANWVYKNWDIINGLSFLPRSEHVYRLAPYEEIEKKRYEEMKEKMRNIDFSKIVTYEKQDETEVKKELACAGGTCEVV